MVFARHVDALAAVKRYDGVLLDEKPMKIEIVGTHFPAPPLVPQVVAPLPFAGGFGNLNASASTRYCGLYIFHLVRIIFASKCWFKSFPVANGINKREKRTKSNL